MAKAVAEALRLVILIVAAAIILQIPIFSGVLRYSQFRQENCVCNERFFVTNTSQQQHQLQQAERSLQQESCKNETTTTSRSRRLKPLGYVHYPFLLFSVYRYALNTFFIIGETSAVVRKFEEDRPVYSCEWSARLPNGTLSESPVLTEAKMMYVKYDENGMAYGPAIVNCTFNQPTLSADDNAGGGGGVLRLHVARGPSHYDGRHSTEEVLQEKAGPLSCASNSNSNDSTAASTVSKIAFCGPPMFGTMKPAWIEQWLTYHNYLWKGDAHFYFYNIGGISRSDADRRVLEPYVRAGLLTIIEVESAAIDEFPAWCRHQLLFINDCIHRTRCAGHSWSFFFDFDELLDVAAPHTIDSLLRENGRAPWMTFGSVPASTGHCAIRDLSSWQLERLMWRNKLPECRKANRDAWQCTGSQGRRKYVVNPSKVFSSGVHRVAVPERGGVDFNASVARVIHFHGALHPKVNLCGVPVNMSHSWQVSSLNSRYDYDESISLAMERAREYAKSHNLLSTSS